MQARTGSGLTGVFFENSKKRNKFLSINKMKKYCILIYADGEDWPYMMNVRAKDLDAAEEQARAFLVEGGGRYEYSEVFEYRFTLWRSLGRKVDYSPNI